MEEGIIRVNGRDRLTLNAFDFDPVAFDDVLKAVTGLDDGAKVGESQEALVV